MRKKAGYVIIAIGITLLMAALSLLVYNEYQGKKAEESATYYLGEVKELVAEAAKSDDNGEETKPDSSEKPDEEPEEGGSSEEEEPTEEEPEPKEMKVVTIEGYDYIGYVSIPSLGLELPVMAEWNYKRLKVSPCRYVGSTFEDNLVIAAHNYKRHFKYINKLVAGERVRFTDMEGNHTDYKVVANDVVKPTDVASVTDSEYDLTLLTCTYGGKTRHVVRCKKIP